MATTRSRRPLCCCEYTNIDGERSHLLTCCCDCRHLDQLIERCITCVRVEPGLCSLVAATFVDRCRYPFPGGARPISIRSIPAALAPPLSLVGSTLGVVATCTFLFLLVALVFLGVPSFPILNRPAVGAASLLLTLLVVYTAEIHPYLDVRTVEAGAIMASLAAGLAFLARAVKLSSTTGSVDRSGATFYSSWLNLYFDQAAKKWLLAGFVALMCSAGCLAGVVAVTACRWKPTPPELAVECPEVYADFHFCLSFLCGVYSLAGAVLLASATARLLIRWKRSPENALDFLQV